MELELVRSVISEALGDDRLRTVGPDVPLLRSGVVTSIETVVVTLALERHTGQANVDTIIPPTAWTLRSLAAALSGQHDASLSTGYPDAPGFAALRAAVSRPLRLLAAAAAVFILLNASTAALVGSVLETEYRAFLEDGHRFYPFSGAFSQDDFRFAIKHHEIYHDGPAVGTSIGFFGDSGTIGSFVNADEAIPAGMERALRQSGHDVRVHNLAWYGRLLAKDFMVLNEVWDRDIDVAVFTLSDDYFSRELVQTWISVFRHISVNRPLFDEFTNRLPEISRGCFAKLGSDLKAADARHLGPARRLAFAALPILHYRPFLQYWWTVRVLPGFIESDQRDQITAVRNGRYAVGRTPRPIVEGLLPTEADDRQFCMLRSVVDALRSRGTKVMFYLEPLGPSEWRSGIVREIRAADLVGELAVATQSLVVDQSWVLTTADFLDSHAHYTADANRRIGDALAAAFIEAKW